MCNPDIKALRKTYRRAKKMKKVYLIIKVFYMFLRLFLLTYSTTITIIYWLIVLKSNKLKNLLIENTFGQLSVKALKPI